MLIKALRRLNVSEYELRWVRHHPLSWMRLMWFQLSMGVLLTLKAAVVSEDIFAQATASQYWPILLGLSAGVCLASTFAPLDDRLQIGVAASLFTIFLLRAGTYADTFFRADLTRPGRSIVVGFLIHWLILALVAVWWPAIAERSGRELTVAAGRDEGRRNAHDTRSS